MCPRSCALKLQGEQGDDTTTFSETTLAVGCGGDEEGDRFLPQRKRAAEEIASEREMGQ
jgi:hypothetical protein